jgi:hypothetical protein
MRQMDKELKTYADNGLRSAGGWLTMGREVPSGTKPRSSATSQGVIVELFTRDQTQPRSRSTRRTQSV